MLSLEPKPKKVSKGLCPKHKQGDCLLKEKTESRNLILKMSRIQKSKLLIIPRTRKFTT